MKKILLFSLCLFLALPCFAEDPSNLVTYPPGQIMGFRGLDTRSNSPNLEDGRSTDLNNVSLSSALDLRKRYGYDTINDSSLDDYDISNPAVTGIFDSEYSNTNSHTYVFVGTKIKYDNSGTWTEVGSHLAAPLVTTGKNYQWTCDMALDNAICNNGTNVPIKLSSTPTKLALDVSDLTDTLTTAKAQIWFRNYLIFGNTTEDGSARPTRFRWSSVGLIETWDDDDYDDISSLSGDEILAFKELYGDLWIIMRKSIWKASLVGGNDVFVYTKIIDGIGAIAKGSVQIVNFPGNKLGIVFLSEDKHIYLFNGATVLDIGEIIQPTLDDLSASRLQYATATFDGTRYFISVTTGSLAYNDTVLVYDTEIQEWTKYDQIDANAFARVKESTSLVKTYFGNYSSMVYWLNNSDLKNDVNGITGIVDSVETATNTKETDLMVLVDADLADTELTGAIVRITSGTGSGQEAIVVDTTNTSMYVAPSFTTTPDSTSNYSVGDINGYYKTKWYDFKDAARDKTFLGTFFWANEASNNEVTVSYSRDFGSTIGSTGVSLEPSSNSLWDQALWDVGTWGTTGDKLYTVKLSGNGKTVQLKFEQTSIDKTFYIYGYHLLGENLDITP